MKQILINGNSTTIFFDEESTSEKICQWFNSRIADNDNIFNLNESYSCYCIEISEEELLITGDEDRVEVIINEITPIKLEIMKKEKQTLSIDDVSERLSLLNKYDIFGGSDCYDTGYIDEDKRDDGQWIKAKDIDNIIKALNTN